MVKGSACAVAVLVCLPLFALELNPLQLQGLTVTPHVQSAEMRYRLAPDFSLGARAQLFLVNTGENALSFPADVGVRLRGRMPDELLRAGEWTWHDFPSAWTNESLALPPGALTVWSWNGKRSGWGTNTSADLTQVATRQTCPCCRN